MEWEWWAELFLGNPDATTTHRDRDIIARCPCPYLDVALWRVPNGVVDRVQHDLPDARSFEVDENALIGQQHPQFRPRAAKQSVGGSRPDAEKACRFRSLGDERQLGCLDLCQVKHVIDHAQQVLAVAPYRQQIVAQRRGTICRAIRLG